MLMNNSDLLCDTMQVSSEMPFKQSLIAKYCCCHELSISCRAQRGSGYKYLRPQAPALMLSWHPLA